MARFFGHADDGRARCEPGHGALHEQPIAEQGGLAPVAAPSQVGASDDHHAGTVGCLPLLGQLRRESQHEGARLSCALLDGLALFHEGADVLHGYRLRAGHQQGDGLLAAGPEALGGADQHSEAWLPGTEQAGGDGVLLGRGEERFPEPGRQAELVVLLHHEIGVQLDARRPGQGLQAGGTDAVVLVQDRVRQHQDVAPTRKPLRKTGRDVCGHLDLRACDHHHSALVEGDVRLGGAQVQRDHPVVVLLQPIAQLPQAVGAAVVDADLLMTRGEADRRALFLEHVADRLGERLL